MFEFKLFLALVAIYLVLGFRSYGRRRAESHRRGTPFALGELGEAVWMSVMWIAWPFGPSSDDERDRRPDSRVGPAGP